MLARYGRAADARDELDVPLHRRLARLADGGAWARARARRRARAGLWAVSVKAYSDGCVAWNDCRRVQVKHPRSTGTAQPAARRCEYPLPCGTPGSRRKRGRRSATFLWLRYVAVCCTLRMAQCATRLRGGGAGPRETFTFRDHPVATHALQEERGLANPRPARQQLNVGAVAVLQASRAHLTSRTDHASVASECLQGQPARPHGRIVAAARPPAGGRNGAGLSGRTKLSCKGRPRPDTSRAPARRAVVR